MGPAYRRVLPNRRGHEEVPWIVDLMGIGEQVDRDFVLARRRARVRRLWRRLRNG